MYASMITLINTNRMSPPIGPLGLDYIAGSARSAGIQTDILDLCLAQEPQEVLKNYFSSHEPALVGLSFRNADDSFWPSADWFVPGLNDIIETIRRLTNAPIVLGGVGYSMFAASIYQRSNADFGVCGDGGFAIIALIKQLEGAGNFPEVPGLIWRDKGTIHYNPPSWPDVLSHNTARNCIDNITYFRLGGQCGVETKRGCNRNCIHCADALAKGNKLCLRKPAEIADEVQSLLRQGIDVLHICDSEFNLSASHVMAICNEFIRRGFGKKIRWYAYMLPAPFNTAIAQAMSQAGCVGIDFTGDSANESMLRTYNHQHSSDDIANAVRLCRQNNIAVMIDLLLGGPGETPQSVKQTIDFIKKINPDCAGAALGVRVYPGTQMEQIVIQQINLGNQACIRRKYSGPLDLLQPTFYISEALGENPAELVNDFIGSDKRFFAPASPRQTQMLSNADGYNYNDNSILQNEILKGARGAYWDILRKTRGL
jgi:tryptophan 2-C-methyltransferase